MRVARGENHVRISAAMSLFRPACLAAAALAAIAACKGSSSKKAAAPEPEAAAATGRVTTPDDGTLFLIARPDVTTMAVPARFSAALPSTLAELSMRQMH